MSYESPNRPQHWFCSSLNSQDLVSTLTFDDVAVSASSVPQIGNADGIGPSPLDLNEVGHPYHPHSEIPSWAGDVVSVGHQGVAARAISNKQFKQFNQQIAVMRETDLEELFSHAGFMNYDICEDVNGSNQPLQHQQLNQISAIDHDPMALQCDCLEQQIMAMSSKMELEECSGENRADGGFDVGFSEGQMSGFGVLLATGISAGSPCDSGMATDKKRRFTDEVFNKTVERRKKRMIKNRESAARSRARKQAYTNQLETEVACLRKTNNWLRKQKEVEQLLESNLRTRYQLRRTSSAQF